jgi:hypothetical protein
MTKVNTQQLLRILITRTGETYKTEWGGSEITFAGSATQSKEMHRKCINWES